MKPVFLPEAVDVVDRLYGFVVAENPAAAQKAMLAIDEGIALLLENPRLGIELCHTPAFRQLFVPFGKSAYVLRYRIDPRNETLVVVRVWLGREYRGQSGR